MSCDALPSGLSASQAPTGCHSMHLGFKARNRPVWGSCSHCDVGLLTSTVVTHDQRWPELGLPEPGVQEAWLLECASIYTHHMGTQVHSLPPAGLHSCAYTCVHSPRKRQVACAYPSSFSFHTHSAGRYLHALRVCFLHAGASCMHTFIYTCEGVASHSGSCLRSLMHTLLHSPAWICL